MTNFVTLPDEIILHIIFTFDASNAGDLQSMKALSITCRRMKDLVNDSSNLSKMTKNMKMLSILFPGTTWTPATLFKFVKIKDQMDVCILKVWTTWIERPRTILDRVFANIWSPVTLRYGIAVRASMLGLNADTPQYGLVDNCLPVGIIGMIAAAVLYQEAFLSRYYVVIPNKSDGAAWLMVRRTLRYVLLCLGPLVAAQILENPLGQNHPIPWVVTREVAAGLRPKQTVLVIGRCCDPVNLPCESWSLGNAIFKEQQDSRWLPTPHYRIDRRIVSKLPGIIRLYHLSGMDRNFFGPLSPRDSEPWSVRANLMQCLQLWNPINPLLF